MSVAVSPLLKVENIRVVFDRFVAINDMSMTVPDKGLRFLIGPNGAGKTTLLDVICGKVRPQIGKVLFNERYPLGKFSEHEIVRLGIGRKFQAPSVFEQLTVMDNLEIAMNQPRGVWDLIKARSGKEQFEKIEQRLVQMKLQHSRHKVAGTLAHGEKQWLEIAMVLLQEPLLLLLDEPVAGMSKSETEQTGELLRDIAKEKAVVVVEHDMQFVRKFAHWVTVMHEGGVLCEGTVDEVQQNEMVQQVYIGRRVEHAG